MNLLCVNDVFSYTCSNLKARILWIDSEYKFCYTIDLNPNKLFIQKMVVSEIEELFDRGEIMFVTDQITGFIDDSSLSLKDQNLLEFSWNIVSSIASREHEPDIFDPVYRANMISKVRTEFNISKMTVYKYLKKYWQGGKLKVALISNYKNCGGKGKDKKLGDRKIGRKNGLAEQNPDEAGINLSNEDKEKIRAAIKKYYLNHRENSLNTAYEIMKSVYYMKITIDKNGVEHTQMPKANEMPTIYQFKYIYYKEFKEPRIDEVKVGRKGKKEFKLNHNAIINNDKHEVIGPGYRFEIDATYPPIYLLNSIKNKNIGKPVIYHITDVFTTLIAGIYIGIGFACWEGAASAIYNCTENKLEFCKRYGLDIKEDEWPTTMLPMSIRADRGEVCGKLSEKIIENLGIAIETTPSYMANMKGTVEGSFSIQERKFKAILNGVIENDYRKRGGSDARLDATMNLQEFTKSVLRCVIHHNNKIMDNYPKTQGMVNDSIVGSPSEIWRWGIKNISGSQSKISSDYIKLNLMRSAKAKVTKRGIEFCDRKYHCETANAEKWYIKARNSGVRYFDIRFDPRNMNDIYLINNGRFELCSLREYETLYFNRTYDEIIDYISEEKIERLRQRDRNNRNNSILYRGLVEDQQKAKRNLKVVSQKDLKYYIKERKAAERSITQAEEAFSLRKSDICAKKCSDAEVEDTNSRRGIFSKIIGVVGDERING